MRDRDAGSFLLGLGIVALGLFYAVGTLAIPVTPTYAKIGPRVFPALTAMGLFITGAAHAFASWRRSSGASKTAGQVRAPADWRAIALVSLGFLINVIFIEILGFVVATGLLFWFAAWGLGGENQRTNALFGFGLALVAYLLFTEGLRLHLPTGIFGGLF